jgi:glycosyltransferase involved in cell wall biosynthesis
MPGPVIVATLMRPQGDTGVQTHFRAFAAWLRGRGHPAQTVTPYDAPLWLVVPVFALRRLIDPVSGAASVWWYRQGHALFLRMALRRRLKAGAACVLYAQCPLSADAALRTRVNPSQRVVMIVHFNLSQADEWAGKGMIAPAGAPARGIRAFEARVLPQLDGLVYVSAFMQRELLARIPALAKVPSAVVPNFVADPGPATLGPMDADLLMVGTLEPRKNQQYALQIVAAAHRAGRTLSLTVAGDGPDRQKLEALAKELGVNQQVRFAGMVPHAAAWFARHRACLHVALVENLPLTLVEALSQGVPVFAVPAGGVPEVFTDGQEGRYLPPDDAERASSLINDWLGHEPTLRRAAVLARQRFSSRFANDVAATRLLRFLEAGEATS